MVLQVGAVVGGCVDGSWDGLWVGPGVIVVMFVVAMAIVCLLGRRVVWQWELAIVREESGKGEKRNIWLCSTNESCHS